MGASVSPEQEVMAMADDNGKREQQPRISITVDAALRRNLRIAAAINDMTIGEWAAEILSKYADKAVKGVK